jgi:molybdopterin converting factor small subunit
MNVRVRLSAGLAPTNGNSRLLITLAENATIADLLDHLCIQHPELALKISMAIPMIAGRHAIPADHLTDAQEVALLLPAAGGSE